MYFPYPNKKKHLVSATILIFAELRLTQSQLVFMFLNCIGDFVPMRGKLLNMSIMSIVYFY